MIKNRLTKKIIAVFLTLNFLQALLPYNLLYASNNGPVAPEATSFEPVDAADMVNLLTGDLSYVLPLLDVPSPEGGFPISLSYHAGITMEQDASWAGLGWTINTGAIERRLNGYPDDWKGAYQREFIHFTDSEEYFNIDAEANIYGVTVGLGVNWGSNKTFGGSVSVGVAGVTATVSADNKGNVGLNAGYKFANGMTVGVGIGISDSKVSSASVGVSKGSYSLNASVSSSGASFGGAYRFGGENSTMRSVGFSLSGNSLSVSASVRESGTGGNAGASISMGSFSSGDYDIKSSSFYIPIGIPKIFSIGFGKKTIKITLSKMYERQIYGPLYYKDAYSQDRGDRLNEDGNLISNANEYGNNKGDLVNYQNKYVYMDVAEAKLPQSEAAIVSDISLAVQKHNFMFPNYDGYSVMAQGLGGSLQPRFFENATLTDKGNVDTDAENTNYKFYSYYHYGNDHKFTKKFGTSSNINFYFDGQYSRTKSVDQYDALANPPAGVHFFDAYLSSTHNIDNNRARQGNFVEAFTNAEISQVSNLMMPTQENDVDRTTTPDGIGGYRITKPDGTTYHYTLPVYHFEKIYRKRIHFGEGTNGERNLIEKRETTPFATHWQLTAITGPNYVKTDSNRNYPSDGDYGYWVRFDYGKWTEGYVWRDPYGKDNSQDNDNFRYNTNFKNEIGEDEKGYYTWGRKEIYYLDKVKTRTHTALFIKSLRKDGKGKDLEFSVNLKTNSSGAPQSINHLENKEKYPDPNQNNKDFVNIDFPNHQFVAHHVLKIDKVVLLKNEHAQNYNVDNNSTLGHMPGINTNNVHAQKSFNFGNNNSGSLSTSYSNSYNIYLEENILDTGDFNTSDLDINNATNSNLYKNAIKVVDFNHSYDLAQGALNSEATLSDVNNPVNGALKGGKLTLNNVSFYGKNAFQSLPPYKFSYKNNITYIADSFEGGTNQQIVASAYQDNWGFINEKSFTTDPAQYNFYGPDNWSLSRIKTPTGGTIDINYEEDDYYTEAFARRVFTPKDFKFKIIHNSTDKYLEIQNIDDTIANDRIKFTDYFNVTEVAWTNFWCCRDNRAFLSGDKDWLRIDQASLPILSLTDDYIRFELPATQINGVSWDAIHQVTGNSFVSLNNNMDEVPDYSCPGQQDALRYVNAKILANRVPTDQTGGGLRIKSLVVTDELQNQYNTEYFYNVPNTSEDPSLTSYRSSGITSFAPVRGEKYVPYQAMLPSAGVNYKYVTMKKVNGQGENLGKIVYEFETLKPTDDIFMENISIGKYFTAVVEDKVLNSSFTNKITSKSIDIQSNLMTLGLVRSTKTYNVFGHLMLQTNNQYLDGLDAISDNGEELRGTDKESFHTFKSLYRKHNDNNTMSLQERFLTLSSKTFYPSVLKSTNGIGDGFKTTTVYKKTDPNTGQFLQTITKMADGTHMKAERFLAYNQYSGMGSKVDNINNKHMLSQEAMTITSVTSEKDVNGDPANWKTINANVTTWKDLWTHITYNGQNNTLGNLWRKHQNFVWKDAVDQNGTYGQELTINDFNWGVNATQSNTEWQKVSEITRYTLWSTPVETKDINGNFASSKMADNFTKTIAGGNARYSEIYFSGAENVSPQGQNFYDGEVLGTDFQSSDVAHTGKYSSKLSNANEKVFEVNGTVGQDHSDASKTFRPGMYKVSFWAYKVNDADNSTALRLNNNLVQLGETVDAGDWKQYNYYINLQPNTSINLFVTNTSGGTSYFDDFRMHPIYASMNSYVYDHDTDQLTHILDANNMATEFRYDDAGRLCKTYKEVFDTDVFVGGFKVTNKYKYNYKDVHITSCQCCDDEVIDFKPLAVNDEINVKTKLNVEIPVTTNDVFGGDGPSSSPISIVTQPVNGTATVNNAGTPSNPEDDFIDYLPPSNFIGTDIITYQICDADGDCSEATVTITLDTPQFDVYFSDIVYSEPFATTAKLNGIPGSTITYFIENYTSDTFGHSGEGIVIVDGVQTIVSQDFPSSGYKTVVVPAIGYVLCSVEQHETTSDNAFTSLFILEATAGVVDAGSELKDGE